MGGPVGEGPSSASHGRRVARPRLSPPCQRGGTSATRTMSPAAPPASPSQCDMFPSQGREMGKGVIGGCSPNGARVLTARSRHPAAGRGHPGGKVTKLPNLARRGPILSSRPHSTSLARYPPIRLAAYPPSAALGRRHRRTASPAPALPESHISEIFRNVSDNNGLRPHIRFEPSGFLRSPILPTASENSALDRSDSDVAANEQDVCIP